MDNLIPFVFPGIVNFKDWKYSTKPLKFARIEKVFSKEKSYIWEQKQLESLGEVMNGKRCEMNGKYYNTYCFETIHMLGAPGFKPTIYEAIKPIPKLIMNRPGKKYITTMYYDLKDSFKPYHTGRTILLVEQQFGSGI